MLENTYLELKRRLEILREDLLKHLDAFIVNELESEDGFIKGDAGRISTFQRSMDDFFDEKSVVFLAFMVYSLEQLLRHQAENFAEDGAEYEDVEFMMDILGVKNGVVQRRRGNQPTVLFALASMSVITTDIINKMQGAFIGNTSVKDFRGAVDRSVRGKFHSFFEVNATAVLFNTYNAAGRFYAKKYGYKKFRYEGGLIADSRDFCIERDGLEFWDYQGEAWNELEWKGKMPGVDFFVQVGGYNCRHWLVWSKDE
jgi:hypothetical protein